MPVRDTNDKRRGYVPQERHIANPSKKECCAKIPCAVLMRKSFTVLLEGYEAYSPKVSRGTLLTQNGVRR